MADGRQLKADSHMKILHTADWHLGKCLHKYSLEKDHQLFLDWLGTTIEERKIDVLLVSGDVFDTAFPPSAALAQYYNFLRRLIGLQCKVIVTGGNHDSPGVLNAPRELLRHLDIKVVGSATTEIEDAFVVLPEYNLGVAAIPFLRDVDLRKSISGQTYQDRAEVIREGIRLHYQQYIDFHREKYSHLTLIGMGHLYVNGATTSDSEREVHSIGGLAAFSTQDFPGGFAYMALGHIHKPQRLSDTVRYSGSPIPLSFSERNDPKYVLELTLTDGSIVDIEQLPVPAFRELRTFSGTLDEVWTDLQAYQTETPLEPLVELNVVEAYFDPQKSVQFDLLLREFDKASFRIIKPRLTYENRIKEADELFAVGTEIEDLSPRDVFNRRLESEDLDEETRSLLQEAFDELMNSVLNEE